MNASVRQPSPIFAIVGPTASGKSALGIALAQRFNGEIINCDSVQVYREIQIATAKVPVAERGGIPHHLIDVVSPGRNYTAGDWARDAISKIDEIDARGTLPMIVGGSGFYLRALREPFFSSPPTDVVLRGRLTQLRERRGALHLYRMLQRMDPASALQLYPRDWPRVQRALEVRFQTGRALSAQRHEMPGPHPHAARVRVFALSPPRPELYRRINARADAHFEAGLVEEVRQLLAAGVSPSSNALGAHGYRRVVEHLRGERDLSSAIEQTRLDVRHYAKRQLSWFRREPGVEWVSGFGEDSEVQRYVASRVEAILCL